MVSVFDSRSSGPGHCVVFLGKTLDSYSDSLHPVVHCVVFLGKTLDSYSDSLHPVVQL